MEMPEESVLCRQEGGGDSERVKVSGEEEEGR